MIVVAAIDPGQPPLPRTDLVGGVEDSLEALTAGACGTADDVLLVCSDDALSRPSRLTRAVLDDPRTGLVSVPGTVTQRAVVVRFLEALPASAYGRAQEVADGVLAACRTSLALSSVARLEGARPSIWQHARSLLPRASFHVDLSAGTVTSARPVVLESPTGSLVCRARSRTLDHLAVELQGHEPDIELAPSDTRTGGAREWTELTWVAEPDALVTGILAAAEPVVCRGCARTVPDSVCPFCGCNSRAPHHRDDLERTPR